MKTAARTRVASGIARDKYGLDARVTVKGIQKTKRFPRDTPLAIMQLWQAETRTALMKAAIEHTALQPPPTNGTLAAEVARYLAQIAAKPSFKSDRANLSAWTDRLGDWTTGDPKRQKTAITTEQINLATTAWKLEGYGNQTLIHRMRVLRELYATLYGKDAFCPVHDAKRPKKPKSMPVDVPPEIMKMVGENLLKAGETKAYARYKVHTTTAQRPCQIERAKPEHVILTGREPKWMVVDAKGESSHTVNLNKDMVKAWKLFIAADAWGKFDTCVHADKLHAAGWPKTIRPYNARHAFVYRALERGANIFDVSGMLGHHSIQTTQIYVKHQPKRMREISKLLEGCYD